MADLPRVCPYCTPQHDAQDPCPSAWRAGIEATSQQEAAATAREDCRIRTYDRHRGGT